MSYADLNEEQLRAIAEHYAVEIDDDASEQDVRNRVSSFSVSEILLDFPEYADALAIKDEEDSGVIKSDATPPKATKKVAAKKAVAKKAPAKAAKADKAETSEPVVNDDHTLLKMTRNNPVYEIRGYRFTRSMPYVYVNNADVDFLVEVEGGFAVAKPADVEAFFG